MLAGTDALPGHDLACVKGLGAFEYQILEANDHRGAFV